jgi:ABC-2 type transport system ATP-binding protein
MVFQPCTVNLQNLGKRFYARWLFRNLNTTVNRNGLAILGPNGSGKSTLLQMISGFVLPSEGKIQVMIDHKTVEPSAQHNVFSISAPYLDLIEEFTFPESIEFQNKFKPFLPGISSSDVLEISGLKAASLTRISEFSSGMKQRAKLSLAILSSTPLLLLDEPCANLDAAAVLWYKDLINKFTDNRTLIVASNHQTDEVFRCSEVLDLSL